MTRSDVAPVASVLIVEPAMVTVCRMLPKAKRASISTPKRLQR